MKNEEEDEEFEFDPIEDFLSDWLESGALDNYSASKEVKAAVKKLADGKRMTAADNRLVLKFVKSLKGKLPKEEVDHYISVMMKRKH